MESTPHMDEVTPVKVREPGKVQRWLRNALLATLPFLGGDGAPAQVPLERAGASARVTTVQEKPNIPGTFLEEQDRNPSITEEGYLDLLAQSLDTPEKLGQYLRTHIQYVREPEGENYWQTPEETIRKGEGDCEDYAFLAQRILQRQGKSAHVVSNLKDHASCVWIQKRPDGNYDGYNFDDFGMDRNGEAGELFRRPHGDTSPRASGEGHESVLAALNAALRSHNGKEYSVNPYLIPVLRIRDCGLKHYDYLTIHAFDPDTPALARISTIEVGALFALLGGAYGTYRLLRRRQEGKKETWREYLTTFHLH